MSEFLPPVVAKLILDVDGFTRGLDDALARLERFSREAAAISDIRVKVTADTDRLRDETKAAAEAAGRDEKIRVKVVADADRLRDEAKAAAEAAGRGLKVTAEIDAKVAAALASIDQVKVRLDALRGRTASPKVDADIAALEAKLRLADIQLDKLAAKREKIVIDADTSPFERALKKLEGASLGPTGMWSNIAPLIIPAIQSVVELTGALGLVPAVATAAGLGLAALAVGVSGVGAAFKAHKAAVEAAASSTAQLAAQQSASANSIITATEAHDGAVRKLADTYRTTADQIRTAEQAVDDAVRRVDTTVRTTTAALISAKQAAAGAVAAEALAEQTAAAGNVSALQAVVRAEESLQAAQRGALRAQQDLTDARQAASRSLEDMASRTANTALEQTAAVLALQQAQTNQAQLAAQGAASGVASTQLQRDQAQLAVEQAQQHIIDVGVAHRRAAQDQEAAAAKGVDGSKQVIAAQDQVAASQRSIHDATVTLGDANVKVGLTQEAGLRSVAAAQQQVADTARALADTQIAGAEQVAAAQRGLVDAQRGLVDAHITGAEQIRAAQQSVGDTTRGLTQASLAAAASAASAAGSMTKYEAALANLAPSARATVTATLALGDAWKATKLDVQQHLFAGLSQQMTALGTTDLPVVRRGLDGMADALNAAATQAVGFATSKQAVADYGTIFDNSSSAARRLTDAVRPILRIITDLSVEGSKFLPTLADHFVKAAEKAAEFVSKARDTGKLHEWIQKGITAFGTLWGIIKDVIAIFKDVAAAPGFGPSLLDDLKFVTGVIRWLVKNMPILVPIIEAFILAWKVAQIAQGIGKMVEAIKAAKVATKLWTAAQWLLNVALDANPIGLIVLAIAAIGVGIYLLWTYCTPFRDFMIGLWDGIKGAAESVGKWFAGPFVNFFKDMWNGIKGFLNFFIDAWNGIHFGIPAMDIFGWHIGGFDLRVPQIPRLAQGGIVGAGGLAMVGEQGPELVALPTGARVYSHPDTASILGAGPAPAGRGGGSVTHITHVHVAVAGSVTTERDLVDAIQTALLRHGTRNVGNATDYSFGGVR